MIRNFTARPFEGVNSLPSYVTNVKIYTLTGRVPGGYEITLARLTTGESVSAGNPLSHCLFESFSDHGIRSRAARTRVSGYDREFISVKNAMMESGVEFNPTIPVTSDVVMQALGEWFQANNDEIESWNVAVQEG